MPKTTRPPIINFRLTLGDTQRIDAVCRLEGKNRPEIVRRAVTDYLDRLGKEQADARETKLEHRLKKMEDRIAGLLARANIDIGVILDIIYRNMPETKRDDVLKTAHKKSVSRLRRKLEIEGEGLVQVYKAEISAGEPEAAGPENKPGS